MNKSFVLATLAAGTTLFVPGVVIYGVLRASFFDNEAMRAEPAMGPLVLGHVFLGAFVALILCLRGVTDARDGFRAGATAGLRMKSWWRGPGRRASGKARAE